MSDVPTADEIEEAVLTDAEAGIQSFSDGTNSVSAMDLEKRLEVVSRLRRSTASEQTHFGLRISTLKGGGAWQ
jgi:hypothetical protein